MNFVNILSQTSVRSVKLAVYITKIYISNALAWKYSLNSQTLLLLGHWRHIGNINKDKS